MRTVRPRLGLNRAYALLLVAVTALVHAATLDVAPDDPTQWTPQQWRSWRDVQIAEILKAESGPEGEKLVSKANLQQRCNDADKILALITAKDPLFFSRDPSMANFVSFVRSQSQMAQPDHALGLNVSDPQYWTLTSRFLEFPLLLKSQDFLGHLAQPSGYAAAVSLIERQNSSLPEDRKWVVLPFEAQFVKSVDKTTYGRLLILVPNEPSKGGATMDKWIMFAISTPETKEPAEIKSVSMITVHRRNSEASRMYFMDFFRQKDRASGKIDLQPTALLADNPSKNCYDCHKSGVVPIHSEKEYRFNEAGQLVPRDKDVGAIAKQLNARIRGYGRQDRGFQDLQSYGPCIAPRGKQRTAEAVKQATADMNLSDSSIERIRASMVCGSCHEDFALINYPQAIQTKGDQTAFKMRRGMLQTYVENGWMPPNNTLTSEERKGLWKSLMREYFDAETMTGTFVDWLKGR